MLCPKCHHVESKVIDSRTAHNDSAIRRRRECLACGHRFTAYEVVEAPLMVIKKDGSREDFDKEKILGGLRHACRKRPVSVGQFDDIVQAVLNKAEQEHLREIPTTEVGRIVMEKLKAIDQVAYVRFASVYLQFQAVGDFEDALNKMRDNK